MKITRFKDIPQFTREGSYQVDMDIRRIPEWIKKRTKRNEFTAKSSISKRACVDR